VAKSWRGFQSAGGEVSWYNCYQSVQTPDVVEVAGLPKTQGSLARSTTGFGGISGEIHYIFLNGIVFNGKPEASVRITAVACGLPSNDDPGRDQANLNRTTPSMTLFFWSLTTSFKFSALDVATY
jgi:hypothetical protein